MLERFSPPAADTDLPAAHRASSDVTRVLVAQALGSGLIAFVTIATGILAERYAGGNIALASFMTAVSGACAFAGLTLSLGIFAGSCFNPALAFALALSRKLPLSAALFSGATQMAAAMVGVMLAHMVTNTGFVQIATQIQYGQPVWIGEFIASALFVFVALRLITAAPRLLPLAGALCLLAIALATPSLSFANPALTLARGLTDSFTSMRLGDASLVVACQFAGALAATLIDGWLFSGANHDSPPKGP
jgi:glycerol uptake facilitator-like aquaporin